MKRAFLIIWVVAETVGLALAASAKSFEAPPWLPWTLGVAIAGAYAAYVACAITRPDFKTDVKNSKRVVSNCTELGVQLSALVFACIYGYESRHVTLDTRDVAALAGATSWCLLAIAGFLFIHLLALNQID